MKSIKIFIAFTFLLAFTVCVSAQTVRTPKKLDNLDLINMNNQAKNLEPGFVTPNELEGFEFFMKGKLNKLRLGVSTKADVRKIFGTDCENPCDYDSNWMVKFDYFEKDFMLISEIGNKNQSNLIEKHYIPKKESIGKVLSITLQPKNRVSFSNIAFSGEFNKSSYLETGYPSPQNDVLGVSLDHYIDSYGLQYFVFDKIVNETLKDTFNLKNEANYQKADLVMIKYMIPKELENMFFMEER